MSEYSALQVNVRLVGFSRIDYNKAEVRKALRSEAALVAKAAKPLVSKRGTSRTGAYPGRRTGLLRRALAAYKPENNKSGMALVISPRRKLLEAARGTADAGYPWMLRVGSEKAGYGWHKDYVRTAFLQRRAAATETLRVALQNALVPR